MLQSLPLPASKNAFYADYPRPNDIPRPLPHPVNVRRFQKDPFPRSAFAAFTSPLPAPPLSPSPSVPLPAILSPYPSSVIHAASRPAPIPNRQPSVPVAVPNSTVQAPATGPPCSSRASISSSIIEDVLIPGDFVGEGCLLQGETIRLVSLGAPPANPDQEPATEFQVKRTLGHGSYAVVYLVQEVMSRPQPSEDGHMPTLGVMEFDGKHTPAGIEYGREYAIKCLSKANLNEEELAAQMSEVTVHQSLRPHPNIVTLHRTLETSSFLLLLLEYVPGEDLFYFLEQARDHYDSDSHHLFDSPSRTPPTPSLLSSLHPAQLLSRTRLRLISSMFSQMCDAVTACHAQQVFHRDIKPENFIVTDGSISFPDGRQERKVIVKLTDFGLSTTDVASSDMDCGSAPYMSYECRNNVAPTYRPRAADVWSLGIVLINMLYHFNPWTDTAHGACSSFDLYRKDPVTFFMYRFTGMTRPVAEYLADKIFCVLDDPEDDSPRTTAQEFGAWSRNLPTLLGNHGMHRTLSTSSQGHPITSSTPLSHRPSSRHPSTSASTGRTPAMQTRSLSRAPSLGPSYETREHPDLSTVFDHEPEPEADEPTPDTRPSQEGQEPVDLRSISNGKRRKRGARKKEKGNNSLDAKDETLVILANASQALAREISKASKSSSANRSVSKASVTSSKRAYEPFEPVAMFAMPSALLTAPRISSTRNALLSLPTTPISAPPVAKKPSIWKLGFGKNNGNAPAASATAPPGRISPVEEVSPRSSIDSDERPMSTTASNVTNLIMGLDAPHHPSPPVSAPTDTGSTWGRGRRNRGPPPSNASSRSLALVSSRSPEHSSERWERCNHRAVSPNSVRSGRPAVASSASSVVSSNWRSSMSTTSSAGTSTSAFTRYSNSSVRSVSTTATSISSTSWRTSVKTSSSVNPRNGYTALPKNIKIMDGVPWELDELPRGQHPSSSADIFSAPPTPRKQRTRKPKEIKQDGKLDTITERPGLGVVKGTEGQRRDASTSTTDLSGLGNEGEGVKKVQKGQINALAKMLSALRR